MCMSSPSNIHPSHAAMPERHWVLEISFNDWASGNSAGDAPGMAFSDEYVEPSFGEIGGTGASYFPGGK
jgi:hypothetical protein